MGPPGFPSIDVTPVLVFTVVMIVTYLFVGCLNDLARARRRQTTERAGVELSVLLFRPDAEAAQAADRLGREPRNLLLDMVQRLATDLNGDAARRLRNFVLTAGLTPAIRRQLRSRGWRRRAQGVALGSLLPNGDPLRTALLDDPHPVVRARAAEGLNESDAVACVDRLIEVLDDAVPAVRFAAQQALLRSGARVVPALERYLSRGDGPGIVWALEIATNLPDPRLIPVHATLLEEQTYLGSVRTMYRVLAEAHEVRERRAQARHPVYTKPELVATGPNQVWSWDITKLKGPIPYLYYSLYVILDLFSRYVVGWMVTRHENAHLAERLLAATCLKQGIAPQATHDPCRPRRAHAEQARRAALLGPEHQRQCSRSNRGFEG